MLPNWITTSKTENSVRLHTFSVARNAIAVNEHNAKMGFGLCHPTAGSAGCLPSVLTAAIAKIRPQP